MCISRIRDDQSADGSLYFIMSTDIAENADQIILRSRDLVMTYDHK